MTNRKIKFYKALVNTFVTGIVLYGIFKCFEIYNKNINPNNIFIKAGFILLSFMAIGYISIFFHELGHAICLRILSYKIGIFKAGPIKYINNRYNRKVFFDKLGLFIIEGYVTPKVNDVIYEELSFDKFVKHYIRFIFSGIIVTIIITISAAILLVFNKFAIFNLLILIFNWPVLIKSLDNQRLSYGDFYLINLLKNKPDYICAGLQNNLVLEYPLNPFLITKIEKFLNDSINKQEYNDLILGLADKVLDEYIIEEKKLSYELERLKEVVFNSYESFDNCNLGSIISIIKVSHKFLLYMHAFNLKSEFIDNFNKIWTYLSEEESLEKNEYIRKVMSTLKYLKEDGNLLEADFEYIISDFEFIANESDNYRRKVALIVDRLSRNGM